MKEMPMPLARRLVQPLSGAVISSWRLIVLAIALLLMSGVLLACNSPSTTSPHGNGCPTPMSPSGPTATPGQRFQIGQQINVNNLYLVSLDSAKLTTSSNGKHVLEVQLLIIDFRISSSLEGLPFTLSSPTGQSYFTVLESDNGAPSCGNLPPAHNMYDLSFEVPQTAHRFVLMLPTGVASLGSLVWDIDIDISA